MSYALGSAIAPMLGGRLTDVTGFRSAADIIAAITLACALVNFALVFLRKFVCFTKYSKETQDNGSSLTLSTRSDSFLSHSTQSFGSVRCTQEEDCLDMDVTIVSLTKWEPIEW